MYYLTGLVMSKLANLRKGNQITINKFLSTTKQQTTVLCDQTSPTPERQDTPKLGNTMHVDTVDSDNTKESDKDFPSAPPIISDSVGGPETKALDCQKSYQTPTTDWS